jgi:hypothetical protein
VPNLPITPLWYASGFRWLASLFEGIADRLERTFGTHERPSTHDLYFDSDVYLAEIRNQALRRYY